MPLTIFQCISCNSIIGNRQDTTSTASKIPIGLDFNQIDNSNVAILAGDLIHCEDQESELHGSSYYTFTCNHCQNPLGILFKTLPIVNGEEETEMFSKNIFYLNPSTYTEYKLEMPLLTSPSPSNQNELQRTNSTGEGCSGEHEMILDELNRLKIFCTTLFKKFTDLQKRIP